LHRSNFFREYVKQALAPALSEGDILVLDNLSSHKVKDVIQPLLDKNIEVVYLPTYSPDFNPIEPAWSKIKTFLRKQKARTKDDFDNAVAASLDYISGLDILHWFKHCGYFKC
jgi:transposase